MRRAIWKKSLIVCSLLGVLTGSQPSMAKEESQISRNLGLVAEGSVSLGRSPASINPLLQSSRPIHRGTHFLLTTPSTKPSSRWRLLGTCRQDSGMFRNQSGMGYGDCNH
ncbi:hypothetical protein EBZ37_04290 [bacterium]|nr:hypothetical protein [bacterium]